MNMRLGYNTMPHLVPHCSTLMSDKQLTNNGHIKLPHMHFSRVMNRATFIMPQSDVSNNHSIMHRSNHPIAHRETTPKKKEESLEVTTILIAPICIHHSHYRLLFACYYHPKLHSTSLYPAKPTMELYWGYPSVSSEKLSHHFHHAIS